MTDIIGFFTSLDALAVLFLVGSLASLWALMRVLIDDLDLGRHPEEFDSLGQYPSEVGEAGPTPGAPMEPPEPKPTDSRRRRAA